MLRPQLLLTIHFISGTVPRTKHQPRFSPSFGDDWETQRISMGVKGAEAGPSRREQRPLVAPRWAYPEQHLRLSSVKQPALREYKRIWVESCTPQKPASSIHDLLSLLSLLIH